MKQKLLYVPGKPVGFQPKNTTHNYLKSKTKSKVPTNPEHQRLPNSIYSSRNGVPLLWSTLNSENLNGDDAIFSYTQENSHSLPIDKQRPKFNKKNCPKHSVQDELKNNSLLYKIADTTKSDSQFINLMEIFWPSPQSLHLPSYESISHKKLPFRKWREYESNLADISKQPVSPVFNDSKTLLGFKSVKKLMEDGSKEEKYQIKRLHHKLEVLGRRLTDRNEVIKKGTAVTNDINKISCPILTRKYVPKLAGSNGMKCNGSKNPRPIPPHNTRTDFQRTPIYPFLQHNPSLEELI